MAKRKEKNKNFIFLVVILLALVVAAYYFSNKASPDTQTLVLRGTVRLGEQLGIDHCKEGVYLDVADDKPFPLIQLRDSNGNMNFGNEFLLQYLNKNVEVIAKYDANKLQCQALICSCDDYVLVQDIKIT